MLLALPAVGHAAKRKVPFGFFGTVLSPEMSDPSRVSDATLDQQFGLMARSGVESARAIFSWRNAEPAQGAYSWARTDRLVASAARHRLLILPIVIETPRWASREPSQVYYERYAPRDPQLFATFVRQLVLRYGPRGSFWAANPGLPKVPLRQWQIYNEQMADFFWASLPWPQTYTEVLKAGYAAIKGADRKAKVVAGSLVGVGNYTQWDGIRDLYRAGAKRYFDAIAIHPFTNNPRSLRDTMNRVVEIIRRVRARMRSRGDGRKPILVTELTWPAAVGRVPSNRLLGLETTKKGQVLRLKAAYARLARERRRLRITQAHWYTWASPYDANIVSSDVTYRFAGLTRYRDGAFSALPILRTYATSARRYEGCRKTANARRCRR